MLVSFCIPCHNRTHDLMKAMPYLLDAASASPPVEIVVIDYNSPDNLKQYIQSVMSMPIDDGISINYSRYVGRDYYHMAHARNLSVLAASGEYFVILSADIWLDREYVPIVRQYIENGYVWMRGTNYLGVIACKRQVFIDIHGYDERFEFYGPEDRDLEMRLCRYVGDPAIIPNHVHVIRTPDEDKIKNYRLPISKREMSRRMRAVYDENRINNVTIINHDGWGRWT